MLNHFFFKDFNGEKLITNDLGRYSFLSDNEFEVLVSEEMSNESSKYQELKNKYFVYDGNKEVFLQDIRDHARYSKNYIFCSTALFIFVVTNRCNANCVYCQAKDSNSLNNGMMSFETAERGVDIAFESPINSINIEFQGGEPLTNFPVIQHIVEYANEKSNALNKRVTYSLVSNLTLLTDEIKNFIKENKIGISTSLDGDKTTHDFNRPLHNHKPSFDLVLSKIKELQNEGLCVGAIETTTSKTLTRYKELVNTYLDNGINTVFIRPLTPLGIAKERWSEIGYTPEDYVDFYRNAISYILQKNKEGHYISEGHARIFLSKMLYGEGVNYMELRSPCGATTGQIAFYYDGRVFTCDEGRMLAEMGNDAFKLGTIQNSYDELVNSSVCKTVCTASLLETLPECCDCAYSPYCGTCPVINLAFDNDIFAKTPHNYRCKVYEGMITVLFEVLQKNDSQEVEILKSWIRGDKDD